MKKVRLYYYLHWTSETLWSSFLDREEEGNPDGEVEQISREEAFKLKSEYGLKYIPNREGE